MIEEFQRFFESESDLFYRELEEANQELAKLDWLNILGEISDEEYLKKVNSINEKPLKNILNFGKNTKKFSMALNHFFGEKEGQNKFNHELGHAKICEKHKIDYFFGIMKFNDIKKREDGFFERTFQPFIQASDQDLVLLNPRERVLFHIENNKAPKNMSSGDIEATEFWEKKLVEVEKLNDFKNTSQSQSDCKQDTSEEPQHPEQSPSENEDN